MLCFLLLLQLLLLLAVLLLHLLQLLLLLLLDLLLLRLIRLLLFHLLLNFLLLSELFLLELLALLILLLLQLLILHLVLLLELRIHGWWSRGDVSRIGRPVLIDPGISRGIRWRVGWLVVRIRLLHIPRIPVLLCVHGGRAIVVLHLARPIGIVRNVVDMRRHDGSCRGNAHRRHSCIRLCVLHFQLAGFRNGNGTALIGLNGRLALSERKRSLRRGGLGDDLTGLQGSWRTRVAD